MNVVILVKIDIILSNFLPNLVLNVDIIMIIKGKNREKSKIFNPKFAYNLGLCK